MVLERPHGGHDHRRVRRKAAVTALEVPEFLVAHFCGKAGFGHVDVAKLQTHPVGNNRTLSQSDVAEGASMHQHGLALDGLDKVGLDGLHQPCGHGAVHFKVGGGHGPAVAVKGKHHAAHALPQIGQIARHGKNGHDFGSNGNVKVRAHHEAIVAPAVAFHADNHVAQGLGAKIHHPAGADARGVNVQTAHAREPLKGGVVIVALVLHAGCEGRHGKIVGRAHGMDIARKVERIRRERDALRKTAASGGTLHAHGGAARRLADSGGRPQTAPRKPLHQTDGGGGLAFAKGRGRDGRNVNVFAVGAVLKPLQHFLLLNLAHVSPVGQHF